MTQLHYTLHWIDNGIIIQSGDCAGEDRLPPMPEGARFELGVEAHPEFEKMHQLSDGSWEPIAWDRFREPEELLAAIERERKLRLSVGFDYPFGDERGVHRIGTTEADERGWDKVTKLASAMILSGNPGGKIQVVTETGPVEVTAVEWQEILIAAGAFQQPIYALSFALQTMTPIPQDVENPSYWGQN